MAANLTLDRNAMKDPSTAHLRIYVGNLSEQANQDNLYDHFSPFGKILGISVNRGFGFVQFEAEQSVQDAINKAKGSSFLGKSINVKPVQTNKKEPENIQSEPPPAVILSDNNVPNDDELQYDEYGNFIGDGAQDDPYANQWGDDKWGVDKGPGRGRGGSMGRGGPVRGRGGQRGRGGYRDRSPIGRGDWGDRGYGDRYPPPEYPRALPVSDKNDCEIIVVSKTLTEYAEYIEQRLKRLGIVVDLLFPMEDVPIGKVLGNIASRGCLYAILVMPTNQEHRSLTLTILHGLPQEHRNMPLEDALQLLSRNFAEVQRGGGASGREAVFALLGQLADGRSLTALQYDKVIKYLQERRELQVKVELGEPMEADKTQVDLQQRILSILNEKPPAEPAPVSVQPPPSQTGLLQDPTVRKALDSILQKFT